MKKIKILHLISGLAVGGAEKVVLDLATKMDPSKFEIHVLSIGQEDHLLPAFQKAGISTTVLNCRKNPIALFFGWLKIRRYINQYDIELIHAHMFHAMFFAGLLRLFKPKLKIVFTSHNINLESGIREFLIRKMHSLREVDVLFSEDMKGSFHHPHVAIIPNGIDTKAYQLATEKNTLFTFLAIGRLSEQKNFLSLIDFAAQLKSSFSFQILIAGIGVEQELLEQAIEKKQLKNHIQLLGLRKDIPLLCNQAHALLIPSSWEGFPVVLLEAGAAAMPVITTPVGAIPRLIHHQNGYPTAINNFPTVMKEVMNNYPEAQKKGRLLQQEIIEKYDLSIIVKRHESLYQKVVKKVLRQN